MGSPIINPNIIAPYYKGLPKRAPNFWKPLKRLGARLSFLKSLLLSSRSRYHESGKTVLVHFRAELQQLQNRAGARALFHRVDFLGPIIRAHRPAVLVQSRS